MRDQDSWNEKVVHNIAKAGFFSSDRTIAQYNADIWHCEGLRGSNETTTLNVHAWLEANQAEK